MTKKGFVYILTLSSTGKKYVGFTYNPSRRFEQHTSRLKNNCHENKRMQEDYNSEPCNVEFALLEQDVPMSVGTKFERLYMELYGTRNPSKGYNDCDPSNVKSRDDSSVFQERIRARRKELGISQSDLAKAFGISRQAISKFELNGASNSVDTVLKFADALHCSPVWLLGWESYITEQIREE